MRQSTYTGDIYWDCPSFDRLHIREWEDEYFVFNPCSGDTHLLNPLSMEIISLLSRESLSIESLSQALLDRFEETDPGQITHHLAEHIGQLRELGLLTPRQP